MPGMRDDPAAGPARCGPRGASRRGRGPGRRAARRSTPKVEGVAATGGDVSARRPERPAELRAVPARCDRCLSRSGASATTPAGSTSRSGRSRGGSPTTPRARTAPAGRRWRATSAGLLLRSSGSSTRYRASRPAGPGHDEHTRRSGHDRRRGRRVVADVGDVSVVRGADAGGPAAGLEVVREAVPAGVAPVRLAGAGSRRCWPPATVRVRRPAVPGQLAAATTAITRTSPARSTTPHSSSSW